MRSSKPQKIFAIIFIACLFIGLTSLSAQITRDTFAGLKARSIGPANMSGRIGAIEGVASDPNLIYVGAAAGGVWKSVDGGLTWTPVFDDQPVSSIGAIAVSPKNPNVVWVGTGEAAPRNSVSVGRGVFLSLDAGKTWKVMGLEKTEKIAKIIIHPDNPDVVFVAALGATWGDSPDRGVFKTTDGGKTWRKVLYVDEKTGAADLAMDPSNPNTLLVSMWEHRRLPWFFTSGGPGSGLFITADGGEKWDKLTTANGLPAGELGRGGLAFAPGRPEVVYALLEATKSVLLRSTDGGHNFQVVNEAANIDNRPFYYSRLWVNPQNENLVYMLATQLSVSEDGGKTFRNLTTSSQSHVDFHAMWIHPDGERLIVGNDGGVVISPNRGGSWRFVANLPLGQFYHINVDTQYPYHVYGGLQDNGTWRGPAYTLRERSVTNESWLSVGGGDGFDAAADPEDPDRGYGMSQGGRLYHFDVRTGSSRDIMPTESDVKHRFNWSAGFAVDPFRPATIYYGSQFVHRSTDKGRTWEIISPDLTTNDADKQKQAESGGLTLDISSAENYCTILSIAPSPLKEGLIWVGTDDGHIQLTRDAGKTWELVSKALTAGGGRFSPRAPRFPTSSPRISRRGRPMSSSTTTAGRTSRLTWRRRAISARPGSAWRPPRSTVTAPSSARTRSTRTCFSSGTEFGLFVSFNGGAGWLKWTSGFPTCPVYDLAIQPRENDLVIATHGRSLYVIDDITPLRQLSDEITKKKLYLFEVPDAVQFQQGRMSVTVNPGDTSFSGDNKPTGAAITYHLLPGEKKPEKDAEKAAETPAGTELGRAGGEARRRHDHDPRHERQIRQPVQRAGEKRAQPRPLEFPGDRGAFGDGARRGGTTDRREGSGPVRRPRPEPDGPAGHLYGQGQVRGPGAHPNFRGPDRPAP